MGAGRVQCGRGDRAVGDCDFGCSFVDLGGAAGDGGALGIAGDCGGRALLDGDAVVFGATVIA